MGRLNLAAVLPAALAAAVLTACDAGPKPADPAVLPRLSIVSPRMDQVLQVPAGKDPTVDASPAALLCTLGSLVPCSPERLAARF